MADVLQVVGAIAAAAAAGFAILTPDPHRRAPAMAVALGLAAALVVGEAWHGQLSDLRDTPAKLAGLLVGGIAAVGATYVLCNRIPILLPLALLAALPFRIPIDAGGESSNLLIPLYVVITAGVLQQISGRSGPSTGTSSASSTGGPSASSTGTSSSSSTGGSSASPPGPPGVGREPGGPDRTPGGPVHWLGIALAAAIVLYAAQTAYSGDISRAVQNVSFFLVPFAVMFVLLREAEWSTRLLRGALLVIVGEAVLFALIGVVQHELGEIFWNSKVMESNEFNSFFRVNSLFWDPNIHGRYLALAALVTVAALLWTESRRHFAIGSAAVAVIFAGIAFSFSQTSMFALLAGLAVLCALRWSLRWTIAAGAAALLVTGAVIAFTSAFEVDSGSDKSLEETTSGRSTLIEGGLDLARDRPLAGYGSGSFAVEFDKEHPVPQGEAAISHTEPVTVAAEQGAIGIASYVALLLASVVVVFGGLRSVAPGLGGTMPWGLEAGNAARARAVARFAVAAAFAGMLVHTIGYAGFLNDPLTWALLALGTALASRPVVTPTVGSSASPPGVAAAGVEPGGPDGSEPPADSAARPTTPPAAPQ